MTAAANKSLADKIAAVAAAADGLRAALDAESMTVMRLSDGSVLNFRMVTDAAFMAFADALGSPVESRCYGGSQWMRTVASFGGVAVEITGPHHTLPEPAEIDTSAMDAAVSAARGVP